MQTLLGVLGWAQWLPQNIFAKALHASSKRKERERERERRTDGQTDRERLRERELVDLLPLQFSLTPDGGLRVSCDLPVSKALTKALQEAMIMKRIFTSSGSDVSSALEHLRSRAHMLGTSLSDPDHIRRKNPDALTRALMNPGNYFRLITARSELKEFQSMLKSNQVKERTGSAGYEISSFDVMHERWSLCLTQTVKLMRSEYKEHMCIKHKNADPNQATWTLYLPLAEGCAFNGPEEFFRSGHHSRLWTLVKKHLSPSFVNLSCRFCLRNIPPPVTWTFSCDIFYCLR